MAGKPKNRLELRRQYEAAEPLDPMEDEADELAEESDDDEAERKPKKKIKPASKPKAVKAAKPTARMRIMWTVVNDAFKPVGTFEYLQKEAAYARAAELTAKGKGTHFVQRVKEPMPEGSMGLGAAVAEASKPAPKAKATKATKAATVKHVPAPKAQVVEDDEVEDDEDADTEAAEDEEEE